MSRALFVVDSRREAGLGHVVRSGALRDEMERRGWTCETIAAHEATPEWAAGIKAPPDAVVYDMQASHLPVIHATVTIAEGVTRQVMIVDNPRDATGYDLLVCGSAGATAEMFAGCAAGQVLAGPEYALLRREFREARSHRECLVQDGKAPKAGLVLDVRTLSGLSAEKIAANMIFAETITTYGGTRAMEAACVLGDRGFLDVYARNPGEELNVLGLAAGAVVDGLGCQRVADAIEALR